MGFNESIRSRSRLHLRDYTRISLNNFNQSCKRYDRPDMILGTFAKESIFADLFWVYLFFLCQCVSDPVRHVRSVQFRKNSTAKIVNETSMLLRVNVSRKTEVFLKFLADTCPFWGHWYPLFWISGDVSKPEWVLPYLLFFRRQM